MRKIIITQSHPDHMGGWKTFRDPGAEMIVQKAFPLIWRERRLLGNFFEPRGTHVMPALAPLGDKKSSWKIGGDEVESPLLFGEFHEFETGGRRFMLYSTPSGETLDSLVVWLPDEKTIFTGNLLGAMYMALPNFYTLRGDRARSVPQFLRDIAHIIALGPELLITGHEDPIAGNRRITADLTRLHRAVSFVHDETVKGMNSGTDLFTLMREISLPPELDLGPGRGRVGWYVRAVWEEYAGWFRQESTTELYAVPPRSIWSELTALVGGVEVIAQHAREHLASRRPIEALHLVEIGFEAHPDSRVLLEVELRAHEMLLDLSEGFAFDEIGWLESKIAAIKARLRQA